ncbi:MAG TPA: STAS domain-containing protein [Opitutaceae bacterium]|nr:STAS domain-containing protein [Opitutaceae bacterium]
MDSKPVFLVDAYSDPILVRIEGRASFLNAAGLKVFFREMMREGKSRFVVDFKHCASMDSTFLGVLAGAALELRKLNPPGVLTLARIEERNLELIRNLGLHRIAQLDAGDFRSTSRPPAQALPGTKQGEVESARLVLEAHESLVAADAANAGKFQDVLAFLRNRVDGR